MNPRRTARWATAAGVTGLVANALLVAFYALELGRSPVLPVSLGSLNDLVGSVSTAMMVPVALAFGPRWVRRTGLAAMGVLTAAGPLLVLGVLPFAVQMPIAITAFMVLAAWMALTSRNLDGTVPRSVSRLGVLSGGGVLAGAAVVGLGFLLPWMSWQQLVVFGIGGVPGALAWLAMPLWFLHLSHGLRPAASALDQEPPSHPVPGPGARRDRPDDHRVRARRAHR